MPVIARLFFTRLVSRSARSGTPVFAEMYDLTIVRTRSRKPGQRQF
jgi:hypothetical protein